jgi:hypothetical protein
MGYGVQKPMPSTGGICACDSAVSREKREFRGSVRDFLELGRGRKKRSEIVEKGLDKDYRSAILTLVENYPEAPAMSGAFCFLGWFWIVGG